MTSSDILYLMDVLLVDESVIDHHLSVIMNRETWDIKHLSNATVLLNYKLFINDTESEDCDNENEYNFLFKLIHQACDETVELVCKITKLILLLNKASLLSKAQHLLQQLFPFISIYDEIEGDSQINLKTTFINLKLFNCVLDILMENNATVTLHGIHPSINNILSSSDELLIKYFLLNTVPRIFSALPDIQILDSIWNYIISIKEEERLRSFKYLTTLADLYFSTDKIILVDLPLFWELILQGLYSSKIEYRKSSLYLIKRSMDNLANNCNLNKANFGGNSKLNWKNNQTYFKDFLTLFECLEEQQCNIVLPALYIFKNIKEMDKCWLNSLFKLGLGHDSKQVKLKCIREYLDHTLESPFEAEILLNSINDMSLFSCTIEVDALIRHFQQLDSTSLFNIFAIISKIAWSPIPLHYMIGTTIDIFLARLKVAGNSVTLLLENRPMVYQVLSEINEMSCNIPLIRESIQNKVAELFVKLCKGNNWRDLKCMKIKVDPVTLLSRHEWCKLELNDINVNISEEEEFTDMLLLSPINLLIASPFLSKSPRCIEVLTSKIAMKLSQIESMVYSNTDVDTNQFLEQIDFINVSCLYCNHVTLSSHSNLPLMKDQIHGSDDSIVITRTIQDKLMVLIDYMSRILTHSQKISYEEGDKLSEAFKNICDLAINYSPGDKLLQFNESLLSLYKTCVQITHNELGDLARTILCLILMNKLYDFLKLHFQEEIQIDQIPKRLAPNLSNGIIVNNEDVLRKLNSFYENEYWCLLSKCNGATLLRVFGVNNEISSSLMDTAEICDNRTLKFVLAVAQNILNSCSSEILDLKKLLSTIWKRIIDIKSLSKEYSKCLWIFTSLFLNKSITQDSSNSEIVLFYFREILQLSSHSLEAYNNILSEICSIKVEDIDAELLSEMISETFIFAPYQRRDQIILDGVLKSLEKEMKPSSIERNDKCFLTFTLVISQKGDILKRVLNITKKKMGSMFLNKQRYHQGSQAHKELFKSLQLMLLIGCYENSTLEEDTLHWCIDLLCQLPHQPDIKACLEWYIGLYFSSKELTLSSSTIQILEKLPTTSKFLVLFHVMKHRLLNNSSSLCQYEYVMEILLLANIMGPNFNLRLHGQYLAKELFKILPTDKFDYTLKLIRKALSENEQEKSYIKIKNDYFINDFDLVKDLNFEFVYNVFPCLYSDEEIEVTSQLTKLDKKIEWVTVKNNNSRLSQTWLKLQSYNDYNYGFIKSNRIIDKCEAIGTSEEFNGVIQKKYLPWKSMGDIDVYQADHVKSENLGEMIVVASLVDKLPNLGGMARTSEVFAVKTLVIDCLRRVQDRQFQGLSLSAERWVDIEEIRPGRALKEYLLKMKMEGYTIVAAEQTSTSVQLQTYQFPKKCLLLLGHEKNGVPCDLLPYMDYCVEVPQQGYVRSLNVHVTAAIFIWEYTRQHLFK